MKRILWLCTHRTQWREEVSLLLEAGFEVVPVRYGHQAYPVEEQPDDPYYIADWRRRCTLPAEVMERIRAVNWFHEAPPDVVPLVREAFDGVIVTSFLDTLLRVARWFPGHVFLRVFGLAGLDTYSRMLGPEGARELRESPAYREGRYHWCPILPTLSYTEEEPLIRGEVVLEPFVSPERLPPRWRADAARPYVGLVLSRLDKVGYYNDWYQRIARCFRAGGAAVPLRIYGQNPPAGGEACDPEVVGSVPDDDYWEGLARAAAFFYQGDSLCHLHWSVLEALAMGVPVVMLRSGFLAWALQSVAGPSARGPTYGVAEGREEARTLLHACVQKPAIGGEIARRQRPLAGYVTDRAGAAREYRRRLVTLKAAAG
jgi:hypothetical protein